MPRIDPRQIGSSRGERSSSAPPVSLVEAVERWERAPGSPGAVNALEDAWGWACYRAQVDALPARRRYQELRRSGMGPRESLRVLELE